MPCAWPVHRPCQREPDPGGGVRSGSDSPKGASQMKGILAWMIGIPIPIIIILYLTHVF
jgi:hypothetical protein